MRGGLETVRLAVRGIGPSLEGSLLLFLSTGLSNRLWPARSSLQLLPLPHYSTVTKWAMSCPRQQSSYTIDVFLWVLKASVLQRLGLTFSVVSTFWVSRFQNTNPCLLSSLGCWCPCHTQCCDSVIYSSHFIYQFLSVELPSVACFPGKILIVTGTVCPSVLRLSSLTLVFLASCRV